MTRTPWTWTPRAHRLAEHAQLALLVVMFFACCVGVA